MSVAWISLVVAVMGTVIALVGTGTSLFFALRADRRQKRSEARAERGNPIVFPWAPPNVQDRAVTYVFNVRNDGHAVITHVFLWVEDAEGESISTGEGGDGALVPGASTIVGAVKVLHPERERQRLMIRWRDRFGEVEEWTGFQPETKRLSD